MRNKFGLYGITKNTGKYEGEFDANNYHPDPEGRPLFRAIFWSIVVSVTGTVLFSAYYDVIFNYLRAL
jgi:hypothetical protein